MSRKLLRAFAILMLLKSVSTSKGDRDDRGSCESITSTNSWKSFGSYQTCKMDNTTVINSNRFHITTTDPSVQSLYLSKNTNIKFLPENIAEKFHKLIILMAQECSIKTISRRNFHGLKKLRGLTLRGNQIEKIESDTFRDLVSLEKLSLYNNKIRSLNGKAFFHLPNLNSVALVNNSCISENFKNDSSIAVMPYVVDNNCGFFECMHEDGNDEHKNEHCSQEKAELGRKSQEIKRLKFDLATANSALSQAKSKDKKLQEAYDQLKEYCEESFDARSGPTLGDQAKGSEAGSDSTLKN